MAVTASVAIRNKIPVPAASPLARIEAWFASRGWKPFDFQREVWEAYRNGESGLIHAATGTGKTYAAGSGPSSNGWMGTEKVIRRCAFSGLLPSVLSSPTPSNLCALPCVDLDIPWRWSPAPEIPALCPCQAGQSAFPRPRHHTRKPCSASRTPRGRSSSATCTSIIVDEWHELMGSKRGVLTELLNWPDYGAGIPRVRTWGLSATLGNLETAMATLLGTTRPMPESSAEWCQSRSCIDSLLPAHMDRFPWAGHLGVNMLPQVLAAIEEGRDHSRLHQHPLANAKSGTRPFWTPAPIGPAPSRSTTALSNAKFATGWKMVCAPELFAASSAPPVWTSASTSTPSIASSRSAARKVSPVCLQRAGRSGHRPGRPQPHHLRAHPRFRTRGSRGRP